MRYKLKFSEEDSHLHDLYKVWFGANGWSYGDLFVFGRDATEGFFYLRHIDGQEEMLVDKAMFELAPPPTKELEDYL